MSGQPAGSAEGPVRPEDLEVTLAVRRDLGPEYEQAVIGEFLDRLGSVIDDRVDARVEVRRPAAARPDRDERPSAALGVVSIVSAIPITAIVLDLTRGSLAGVILLIVAWVAIAGINVLHTRSR